MFSDQYKRELSQLTKDIGKIRSEIGKEEAAAGKARSAAAQKRTQSQRTSTSSTRDNYLRQAEGEDKKVAAAETKIGSLHDRLATLLARQNSKEQSLRNSLRNEQNAVDRAEAARRQKAKTDEKTRLRAVEQQLRKHKAEQTVKDKADTKRRQVEKDHARELMRLSRPVVHHIVVRDPEPERLRVLYLTASPATPNLPKLRVDAEVNQVLKAIRSSKHRDLVDLIHRPAAMLEDLTNGLNDHRPHVIHFSGHAGDGLLFESAGLHENSDHLLSFEFVSRVIAATDRGPTLIVLNACQTVGGAEEMLKAAPIVISTTETVNDATSAIFAKHFYDAIGGAQSVGDAFNQVNLAIAAALPDEVDVFVMHSVEGVDVQAVRLVRPSL